MADAAKDAKKLLDEQQKDRDAANKAAQDLMDNAQPTPTQRENDLARLGALDIDKKESDGAPPEDLEVVVHNRAIEAEKPGAYKTK